MTLNLEEQNVLNLLMSSDTANRDIGVLQSVNYPQVRAVMRDPTLYFGADERILWFYCHKGVYYTVGFAFEWVYADLPPDLEIHLRAWKDYGHNKPTKRYLKGRGFSVVEPPPRFFTRKDIKKVFCLERRGNFYRVAKLTAAYQTPESWVLASPEFILSEKSAQALYPYLFMLRFIGQEVAKDWGMELGDRDIDLSVRYLHREFDSRSYQVDWQTYGYCTAHLEYPGTTFPRYFNYATKRFTGAALGLALMQKSYH